MIALSDFLARLQGVEDKGGGQYMARCPCHDDKRASLAVKLGEKKIVCECLAGCDYGDIIGALGLDWRDVIKPEYLKEYSGKPRPGKRRAGLASGKTAAAPAALPKEKKPADLEKLRVGGEYIHKATDRVTGQSYTAREPITHCYEYQNEKGKPLMRVFRTEDKSFPVIHEEGGKWWWGDGGHADLLYRLPQVRKAVAQGERIYIVEGEKDVETLEKMGLRGTTNKGGAGKWPEKCTAELENALVAIVPDIDEAGRKHGRLVAKALEGHAKEVRILNLQRLSGVKLPEKGDISDVAQLLGVRKAAECLGQLLEHSPVLSRKVSDTDYEDYFNCINGARVLNGCICGFKADAWHPLCNFVALPVEQVLMDDGLGNPEYQLTVMGWSSKGYRLKTLSVKMADFDAMVWPMTGWGLDANINEGAGVKQKLRRIIQEAGSRTAVARTVYAHTGWRRIDGKWCFLHGGGAIGAEDVRVRMDYGLHERYVLGGLRSGPWLDEPGAIRRALCQGVSIRAMGVAGLRIGVPLVGFAYLAPLRHFLQQAGRRPSFVPFVRGGSGTGKSTMVSLILNHFGYDFSYEASMPANFENSAGSIGLKLFELKDLPLMVDDYHPESDAKRAAAMAAVAESISRMIGDGAMRSRLKSDATAQADKPIRGLCIETGEDLPKVAPSSVARLYVIDVGPEDVPLPIHLKTCNAAYRQRIEEMKDLHKLARQGALNEAMRGYIEWLAARADTLPEELEARYEELMAQALARSDGAHARSPTALAYLMLGIRMMLEYMSEPDGIFSREDVPGLMDEYWTAIMANAKEQAKEMAMDKPTELFLTTVRELVQSGRCVVQDLKSFAAVPPMGLIGYRDEMYYYLNPGQTFGAVQKSLIDQGVRFPIGKNMLFRQLATEEKLVRDSSGKNVRQLNRGGIHAWMLWIPRYVLDETKPRMREEQLTAVPLEEDRENPFRKGGDET